MSKTDQSQNAPVCVSVDDLTEKWTKVPNVFIDKVLPDPEITGAAIASYLVILRNTIGWNRIWALFSTEDLVQKTSYKKNAIISGLNILERKQLVVSKYICSHCGSTAIDHKEDTTENGRKLRRFCCQNCGTKEAPSKAYALKLDGIDLDTKWKNEFKGLLKLLSGNKEIERFIKDERLLDNHTTSDERLLDNATTGSAIMQQPQSKANSSKPKQSNPSHDQQNSSKESIKEKERKNTQRTVVDHSIQEEQTETENDSVCDISNNEELEKEPEAEKMIAPDPATSKSEVIPPEVEAPKAKPETKPDPVEPEEESNINHNTLQFQKAFVEKFPGHPPNDSSVRPYLDMLPLETMLEALEKCPSYQRGRKMNEVLQQIFDIGKNIKKQKAAPEVNAFLNEFTETFDAHDNAKDKATIRELIEKHGLELCKKHFKYIKIQHGVRPVYKPIGYLISNVRNDAAPPADVAEFIKKEEYREAKRQREDKLYDIGSAINEVTQKHLPKVPRMWTFGTVRMDDLVIEKMVDAGVAVDAVSTFVDDFLAAERHPGGMFNALTAEFLPDFVEQEPPAIIEKPVAPERIVSDRKAEAESLANILGGALSGIAAAGN